MENRYLFWFSVSFVTISAIAALFKTTAGFLCAFFSAVIITVTLLCFKKAKRAAVLVIAGALASLLWQIAFVETEVLPDELFKNTQSVVAEVTSYSKPNKTGKSISVTTEINLEGEKVRALVYIMGFSSELAPGDVISMDASFERFENTDIFRAETYYKSRYIDVLAFSSGAKIIKKSSGVAFKYLPQYLAKKINDKISLLYNGEEASFMKSLLIGNKDELSESTKAALRATGLTHTISVSGMHVSFLVGFVLFFTKNKYLKLLCIPLMLLFALAVGAPQSALRAVIMQSLLLVSALSKREYDSLTALSFAACVLVMLNPYCVTDLAFILSFSATLGIVLFSRPIANFLIEKFGIRKKGIWKKISNSFFLTISLSVSATLLTAPILAYAYNSLSVISVFVNMMLAGPIAFIFIFGFVNVLTGFVCMPIAKGVAFFMNILTGAVLGLVNSFSKLSFASVATHNPVVILLIVYLCVVAVYAIAVGRRKLRASFSVAMVVIATICTAIAFSIKTPAPVHNGIRFDVLDVGQGQCVVVTCGDECAVIDCGGDKDAAGILIRHLTANGIEDIDALVFTHAHEDHANGGRELVESVHTEKIYMPYTDKDNSRFQSICRGFENGEVVFVKEDTTLLLGDMEIEVLTLPPGSDENENGIVILVRDGEYEALITGDIPESSEELVLGKLPDCESYVVGHHGSKTSSSQALINKILPELAVISVGEGNSYEHPAELTLKKLLQIGAKIARTDTDGTVTFYSR